MIIHDTTKNHTVKIATRLRCAEGDVYRCTQLACWNRGSQCYAASRTFLSLAYRQHRIALAIDLLQSMY